MNLSQWRSSFKPSDRNLSLCVNGKGGHCAIICFIQSFYAPISAPNWDHENNPRTHRVDKVTACNIVRGAAFPNFFAADIFLNLSYKKCKYHGFAPFFYFCGSKT